ncbi:acyl-CoA N-acyltransferase [Leucogyrophana mollusca]|uniref:Acyl-CoA N-acyltransferase n=1 Tax=Leucogyrophana mollusca TaxID=85980 RepID=A0ACB8BWG7_9AGAM|nr:acyl-CoA N-acyltransferase [Leucogyrophana mollusca]
MSTPAAPSSASRVSFAPLTSKNLGTVRKLNSVLFPIKYSERFYNDILQPEVEDFCQLVYYNDVPVGNICCRLETNDDGQTKLYLMTMGILAVSWDRILICQRRQQTLRLNPQPYRSRHLGSQSLELVLKAAAAHTKPKISRIYLHVQVSNDAAKKFYERHGFKEVGIHQDYYKKIEPRDAWILEREIGDEAVN